MELEVLGNKADTEVGSYFISNYPPYSVWDREKVPEALAVLAEKPAEPPPLGLYLHIPFCRKRCKFCYFRVYTDKNSKDVDTYMQGLADEIALYSQQPQFADRQFEFVYFGGGTPSFLSADQLKRLIDRINEHWRWDAAREVTFECEPGTLRESKLKAIKAIGVTRLSLGIEHFDDRILELNGRAHLSKEILRAYQWAREVGFNQINVDLIAGMVGDTEKTWKETVEKTLQLQPDSLTIYQMELPHNAVFSQQIKDGSDDVYVADWPTKRAWVQYAFEQFEAAGYEISSGYTVVKPSEHSGFVYRDSLWRGADMVGTGVASISHVGGVHFQNVDKWDKYLGAINEGRLPIGRALPIDKQQRLIRELALQLKLGRLDFAYFRQKFDIDPASAFADAFKQLQEWDFVEMSDGGAALKRPGLLRVDGLLPLFFQPEHRSIRYT